MHHKKTLRTFFIYWLPPVAWMVFIFPSNQVLTVQSTSSILVPILNWIFPNATQATVDILHVTVRKFFHFFDFAFLAFLLFRAFQTDTKEWKLLWVLYSGAIATGYAGLDEFIQTMVPLREGSVYDWLLDTAGVVFTVSLLYVKSKKTKTIHAETGI